MLLGIAGSVLAILAFFVPYLEFDENFAREIALLDPSIKPTMSVYDMFSNGTGKVASVAGTLILIANIVVIYYKPQVWLEFLALCFAALPLLFKSIMNEGILEYAKSGLGQGFTVIALILLSVSLIIDWCLFIRNMKKPRTVLLSGLIILAIYVLLCFTPVVALVTGTLLPFSILILITAGLGSIFRKTPSEGSINEDSLDNETDITNDESPEEQSGNTDRKKWITWGAIVALCISVVSLIFVFRSSHSSSEETERWVVCDDGAVMFESYDGYMGIDTVTTLGSNNYFEVERFTPDGIWAYGYHHDPYEKKKFRGYVAKDKLITHAEYLAKVQDFIGDHSDVESETQDQPAPVSEENENVTVSSEEISDNNGPMEPEGDEYTHSYQGTINDKYGIEMTLTSDGRAYYTGEYFYTKNKTPIQLRGQLVDDRERLVLGEYVGMKQTGKFDGILSGKKYSGTWTSADGETSYPFSVTLK